MRFLKSLLTFAMLLTLSQLAHAQLASQGIALQGKILNAANIPEEAASVAFRVQIYSPGVENCLLYQETQTLNMANSGGIFSLVVGTGARTNSGFAGTSALKTVFSNAVGLSGLTCSSGSTYTPLIGDGRNVILSFNDGTGAQTLTQALSIGSVPYAMYADTLQGKLPGDFINVNSATAAVTQTNLEQVFASSANVTKLLGLIAGSSTVSGNTTFSGGVAFTSDPTTTAAPTTAISLVNKTYSDGYIAGKAIDPTTITALTNNTLATGDVLQWSGSTWTAVAPAASTGTFVNGGNSFGAAASLGTNDNFALNIKTNNTTAVTVDTSGHVGVGTTAPSANLDVEASGCCAPLASFQSDSIAQLRVATTASLPAFIQMVGNGGTSPWILEATGAANFSIGNSGNINAPNPSFNLNNNGGTALGTAYAGTINPPANGLIVQGNVGIGTATPSSLLQVASPSGDTIVGVGPSSISNSNAFINLVGKQGGVAKGAQIYAAGDGNLNLQPYPGVNTTIRSGAGTVIAAFSDSALVGIGTTAPNYSLDLGSRTDAILLPSGTTAQQPTSLTAGLVRYNNNNSTPPGWVEFYNGTAWVTLVNGSNTGNLNNVGTISGAGAMTIQPTGSNHDLTLSDSTGGSIDLTTTSGNVVVSAGGVGYVSVPGTVASTSPSTGALVVGGGVGIAGSLNVASNISTASSMMAASLYAPLIYGTSTANGNLTIDSTSNATKGTIALAPSGGNVGIGTASPQSILHLSQANPGAVGPTLFLSNPSPLQSGASGNAIQISFGADSAASATSPSAYIRSQEDGSSSYGTSLQFGTIASGGGAVAERVRIAPNGNVGIGTASPNAQLDVSGSVHASGTGGFGFSSNPNVFMQENYGLLIGLGGTGSQFSANFINSGGTSVMAVRADGTVGIGTTAPAATLDVNGTGNFSNILGIPGGVGTNPGFHFSTGGSADSYGTNIGFGLDTGYNIVAAVSNESFRVVNASGATPWQTTNGGNTSQLGTLTVLGTGASSFAGAVGIGTTAPAGTLAMNTSDPSVWFKDTASNPFDGSGLGVLNFGSVAPAAYASIAVNRVAGTYDDNTSMIFSTSGNGFGYGVNQERMRISYDGKVGVGTTAPSEKLHVVGNLRVQGSTDCTLGNGSGGTMCSSDRRLKNDIVPIQTALDKILTLTGVEFNWNEKSQSPGRHDIGVIAQDVEKVFPTAVMIDPNTGYRKVDYAVLIAPVIQALKEINQKVENLLGLSQIQTAQIAQLQLEIANKDREIASIRAAADDASARAAKAELENQALEDRLSKIEAQLNPQTKP